MLEVLIIKTTTTPDQGILRSEHALDLPADIQIPITIENPFMLEDRIPIPFSLSFNIPPTPQNLELFKQPNRLGSYGVSVTSSSVRFPCDIRFNSVKMLTGQLHMTSFEDLIEVTFQGIDYNDHLKAKLYDIDFGQQEFTGDYGPGPTDFDNPSRFEYNYRQVAEHAASGLDPRFVLAPLSIINRNQPLASIEQLRVMAPGYETPYVSKRPWYAQDDEYLNCYNPTDQNFMISKPNDVASLPVSKSHAGIFPMFRVGWMISQILGDLLVANPFGSGDLYNVVMPTYYFRPWKERTYAQASDSEDSNRQYPAMVSNPKSSPDSGYDSQPYIDFRDYMPDVAANDFIKDFLNMFCMAMIPVEGKVKIVTNKSIIASSVLYDWSPKLIGQPKINFEDGKEYVYGYAEEDSDYTPSNEVIELSALPLIWGYPFSLNEYGYSEQIFHISFTRQYIKKEIQRQNILIGPISQDNRIDYNFTTYTVMNNEFGGKNQATGRRNKYEVKTNIQPPSINTGGCFDYMFALNTHVADLLSWEVPAINVDSRTMRPSTIPVLIFKGENNANGDPTKPYPFATSNHHFMGSELTLDWDIRSTGLIRTFHEEFKEWIEKNKLKLSGQFLLNAVDYHNLDITQKVHVHGRNFFIEKIQFTIRHDRIDPALVDLIEV